MPKHDWTEVGDLVTVTVVTFHQELPKGTIFESKGGVQIFFSSEEIDKLNEAL